MKHACRKLGISRWPFSRWSSEVVAESESRNEGASSESDGDTTERNVPAGDLLWGEDMNMSDATETSSSWSFSSSEFLSQHLETMSSEHQTPGNNEGAGNESLRREDISWLKWYLRCDMMSDEI